MNPSRNSGPRPLAEVLAEVVALRGLARVQGDAQLTEIWNSIAGPEIANSTRVIGIKRGVLQIGVRAAPLLSELVSFHQHAFKQILQQKHADLKIRDLKFILQGGMKKRQGS